MNKVVLITGASAGMGKETAKLLAATGYTVYGAARRVEKMKDLEPLGIKTLAMDVTDEASMVSGVEQILAKEDRIDVLVNNAGFGSYGAIEDVPIADAKYQLDVNVFGAARLIQLVLPSMRRSGWGKIINISSIGGKFATPYGGWYHASKFALEGLSDALRNEVKPFGIDVVVIEPGGVKSEWGQLAYDNLIKSSRQSAYRETIDKLAGFLEKAGEKNVEPMVIAELIREAIEAKRPKFRYVAGYMAKQLVIVRKLLPDRLFDRVIMGQFR
ncbi:oxidoreductase [Parapedobacter koreensis]|uniref:NADP-dependent 3-hydroxy acid dehydrogenase YdfG n=1 Tax=Parapedobacter koreensis TaxID=332977 RepID=A0A1H7LMS2_9SPHI|nr:oxidoreductase [Parapedobacter koreensis]SEL00149.1 NADP-dependent 3-hydroxy acid dehydrogenase YdfG [Parapedobacter koreensis]